MVAEFTPGPWQYRGDGTLQGRNYYAILSDDSTEVAYTRSGNYAIENGAANARLIAAAPIMYKYVATQAASGDNEAKQILEGIIGSAEGPKVMEYRNR